MFTHNELGLDAEEVYETDLASYSRRLHEAESRGEVFEAGRLHLMVAICLEKLGRSAEALSMAEQSRSVLRALDEWDWLAECTHSLGVWRFHNLVGSAPYDDFTEAIAARRRAGNVVGEAQAWHNLGFVQLVSGRPSDAAASYESALELLRSVVSGPDADRATFAFRQIGFILSHQAYAAGAYSDLDGALAATARYFEHVEQTGAHREPVYAFLAPALALARVTITDSPNVSRLRDLTGIGPDPDLWLQRARREAASALVTHAETGTGRHAYLGAHLLALAESARRAFAVGDSEAGETFVAHGLALATARGWDGEAARVAAARPI